MEKKHKELNELKRMYKGKKVWIHNRRQNESAVQPRKKESGGGGMNGIVDRLNALPVESLERIVNSACNTRLLIEDGKITGYMNGDNGKLFKEKIPVKTGNQDRD